MSEYPIDFCIHLARAIAKNQKTRTYKPLSAREQQLHAAKQSVSSPYGQIGDVLWVREPYGLLDGKVVYRADYAGDGYRARADLPIDIEISATPMERAQARSLLVVRSIDIVNLQIVDEAAAIAAGTLPSQGRTTYLDEFKTQWNDAYRRQPWESNPLVWQVSFTLKT
jgi:hypothetical protein